MAVVFFFGGADLPHLIISQMLTEHVPQDVDVASPESSEKHLRLERYTAWSEDIDPGREVLLGGVDERAVEIPEHTLRLIRHPDLLPVTRGAWPVRMRAHLLCPQ